MSCGCQVQSHRNVEGQSEHRKVPFTEDGSQSAGQDWTEREQERRNEHNLFMTLAVVKHSTTLVISSGKLSNISIYLYLYLYSVYISVSICIYIHIVTFNSLKDVRRWSWNRTKAEEVIKGGGKSSVKKDGKCLLF